MQLISPHQQKQKQNKMAPPDDAIIIKIAQPQTVPPHFYTFQGGCRPKPDSLAGLFDSCTEDFKRVPDLDSLDESICQLWEALEPGATWLDTARGLLRAGAAYADRRRRTHSPFDQLAVAMLLREAALAIPDDHADKAVVLDLAGTASGQRYAETRWWDDYITMIELLKTILEVVSGSAMRARVLEVLGGFTTVHFMSSGQIGFANESISYLESCLALIPASDLARLRVGDLLLRVAHRKYHSTKKTEDLEYVIICRRRFMQMTPDHDDADDGDAIRLLDWVRLTTDSCLLAVRRRDQAMLEKAVALADTTLNRLPDNHPSRPFVLYNQGAAYEALHELTGELALLQVAVHEYQEALPMIPQNTPGREGWVERAAEAARCFFSKSPGVESRDILSSLLDLELERLPVDSSSRRGTLRLAARLKFDRSWMSPDPALTAEAIRGYSLSLVGRPPEDPDRSKDENHLALLMAREKVLRGETLSEPELKALSENQACQTLCVVPRTGPASVRAKLMHMSLGGAESLGVERTKDTASVRTWIRSLEDMLEGLSPNDPSRFQVGMHIGFSYAELWNRTNDMHDYDRATEYFNKISQIEVNDGPNKHLQPVFAHLAINLEHTSKMLRGAARPELDQNLSTCIQATEDLTAMKGPNELSAWSLAQTANILRSRWSDARDEEDLDQCIQLYRESLARMPDSFNNSPAKSNLLHASGDAFLQRYLWRNVLDDLETAIQYLEQSIKESASVDRERRAAQLNTLGVSYIARHPRTSDPEDLSTGLRKLEEAIDLCETYTARNARYHTDLATAYLAQYETSRDPSDINHGIHLAEESIRIGQRLGEASGHAKFPLAWMYKARYKLSHDAQDWVLQVQCLQDCLSQLEERSHAWWMCSNLLGSAFAELYEITGLEAHARVARSYFEAAPSSSSHFMSKITSMTAESHFYLFVSKGEWPQAFRVASDLVSQLHHQMGWSLKPVDKQFLLRRLVELGPDAAGVALLAKESPFTALRQLETARSVIINSLLGLRSEVDELRRRHPEEAERYLELRSRIDAAEGSPTSAAAAYLPAHEPTYRYDVSKELDKVIESIRALPTGDFGSFLEGPSEEDMKAAAAEGPIVVVNTSRFGCDAIIIKNDGITALRLDNVTMDDIKRRAQENTGSQSCKNDVLEWLWDKIVEPVLERLCFITSCHETGAWPRIQWVPTGALSRLPLHAAGYHHSPGHKTAVDRVISSYSISVSALVQSRASLLKGERNSSKVQDGREGGPTPQAGSDKPGLLSVVAMEELPNAGKEIGQVVNICRAMEVSRPTSSRQQVLDSLKTCDIFHFAGHGTSNYRDPLSSALLLRDSERLSVSHLLEVNLHERPQQSQPFLAFLSACSTGQIRQDENVDEGLHLMSAFQLAGFRHVIGTLWEVRDETCVQAAALVYKWMHVQGMTHASVAEALHFASRELRDRWLKESRQGRHPRWHSESTGQDQTRDKLRTIRSAKESPLFWVPYVHYGI